MKRIFFSVFTILFFLSMQNVFAQEYVQNDVLLTTTVDEENLGVPIEQDLPAGDVEGASFDSDEVYVPEIIVDLGDMKFNENSRVLTASTVVVNTTDTFLDNLQYTLELMKGDELVENGYVFENTEYLYQEMHEFGKLAPHERKNIDMTITVPNNIDTANYFLQIFVNDKNLKFQNNTYTEQPFELSGTGGRLAGLKVYFYADRYGEKTFPAAGLSTEPDDEVKLILPLEENQSVKELLNVGEQLHAKVQVFRTIKDSGLVKEFETDFDHENISGQDSLTVSLLADNEELRRGGSFNVHISVLNEAGEELYERNMRWLIEFGQIVGRILSVESGKNVYTKGESIDLTIETALINSVGQKGLFEVLLIGRDNFEQKITKEVVFAEVDAEKFSFADYSINDDTHLTGIKVSLKDVEKNIVVDEYNTDIDFDQVYARDIKKQNSPLTFSQDNQYIIWMIASIIFGFLAIVIYKFVEKRRGMRMIIVILLGVNMFFLTSYTVDALCACGASSVSGKVWVTSNPPSSVVCGKKATMRVNLKVSCSACVNGIQTKIYTSAGETRTDSYGHVNNPTVSHSFSQTINKRTQMWAKAYFTRNGCHCCPGSRPSSGSGCLWSSGNASMCNISKHIGTVSKWVNCTPAKVNGSCGTGNKSPHEYTFAHDSIIWGVRTNFCNKGTPIPATVAKPTQANPKTTWKCSGSNGGDDSGECWTKIAPPPRIDGGCSTGQIASTIPSTQTNWSSTLPTHFCAAGTPSPNPPTFPGYGESVSWNCIGSGPDHTDATNCSAQRATPQPQCGNAHNKLTNTKPVLELCLAQGDSAQCSWPGNSEAGVALDENGWWNWQCRHTSPAATNNPVQCHAPSCIANNPVSATSPVMLSDDMHSTVSVACPGANLCCEVTNETNNDVVIACSGSPQEITISPGQNDLSSICWFDDNNDGENDPDEPEKDGNSNTVQTMCVARECNTQGTCQATPKIGSSTDACSSTCSSNADCSSGRIIETRP